MRVAIAHEWLVKYGGSERCVEEMLAEFPDAVLLTTVLDARQVPTALSDARPSFLQALPRSTRYYEWLLPLMPLAWRLNGPPADADVVISSSHACAKGIRVPPGIPHLCYCHTPMRYAWDFEAERERFPKGLRKAAQAAMPLLRKWDRATASSVTRFVANSTAVAHRIVQHYGRTAQVIHPPVRTEYFTPDGARGSGSETFVHVGRLVSYKRPDLVVEAFADLPYELVVVGDGHLAPRLRRTATPNVRFLGDVSDERLREIYRSARAAVFPANEDFGIAMAEAQSCGTPVIGLNAGGARDIVDPGTTGWLVDRPELDLLRAAVRRAATEDLDRDGIRVRAARFSRERFRREFRAAVEELLEDQKRGR